VKEVGDAMTPEDQDNRERYEELAGRLANLEPEAFREFADDFGRRFEAWFRKRGLNAADAEALATTCVTEISLAAVRYRRGRGHGFLLWVWAEIRRRWSAWFASRDGAIPTDPIILNAAAVQIEVEHDLEALAAVDDALGRLSPEDSQIIRLRDLGVQLSYEEIGERIGVKPAACRERHIRAFKRFRALLEQDPRCRHLREVGKPSEEKVET